MSSTNTERPVFTDHFGKVGSKYLAFRPSYPQELFDVIKEHTADTPRDLAIDIGCGNGQATIEIAKFFKKVIGFEPSLGQISNAQKADNVEYKQSPAEKIDLTDDHSVDLVTVAQAAHWFDLPVFFQEAHRLLKPNGSLILWSYGICQMINNKEAEQVHIDFYEGILGDKYWPSSRKFVDRKYIDIVPPFDNVVRREFEFSLPKTIED
eukprot:gene403-476_t